MIGKKLIITEEERKEIKTLYGLITEQDATQKNPELTLDLAGTFGSGKYLIPGKADKIDDLINQIREFKKQNAGSVIEIQINSGESQVPNYDREKFPDGNDTRPEAKLNVGDLGKKRAVSLETYLKTNAPDLLEDAKIVKNEPVIGTTAWVTSKGSRHPDYTKEQFANFKIKVIGKKPTMSELPSSGSTDCATGLRIKVWVPSHECNNAEFFIMLNNTILYNVDGGYTANLNNAGTTKDVYGKELVPQLLNPGYGYISTKYGRNKKGDLKGARLDEFIVTPEQSKTIVQSGKGYIYIWMIGTTEQVHRDIPRVSITKNGEVVYEGEPKVASGLLLVLDACGNKVTKIPEESNSTQPNVSSWLSKLVSDRSKINVEEKLPKKIDSKEVLLKSSGKLVSLINNLESYLKTNIFKGQNKNNEAREYYTLRNKKANIINQTYFDVYQILQSNNWMRKEPLENSYSNKDVEGKMGGDIKLDLDEFYNKFNKIYYNNSESKYYPSGVRNAPLIAKNLGIKYS